MPILGWSASVFSCARARIGKVSACALLALVAALSYTRAHAQTPARSAQAPVKPSGRTPAQLAQALRTAKPADVPALEAELMSYGDGAVRPLIEIMSANRGQDRILALIAKLGPKAPGALVELLGDDALRPAAARALSHAAGASSGGQAEALIDCLSKHPDVKHDCGVALVRGVRPGQGAVVPRLARAVKSADRDERLYAALALKQIGLKTSGVREALMTAVSDPDDEVRGVVRKTGLRPAPKAASPAKGGKAK